MRVTKQYVCKVVNSCGSRLLTRNNTAWKIGVPQFSRSFKNAVRLDSLKIADYRVGKLHPIKNRPSTAPQVLSPCSANAVHWYIHPIQAMMFYPIHTSFLYPTFFRAKPLGRLELSASKCWSDGLVLVEEDDYFTKLAQTVSLSSKYEHVLADIISINFIVAVLDEVRKRVRPRYSEHLANLNKAVKIIRKFFRYAKSCKDFSLRDHPQAEVILSVKSKSTAPRDVGSLFMIIDHTSTVTLNVPVMEVDGECVMLKSWCICLLGATFNICAESLYDITSLFEYATVRLQEKFGVSDEATMRMILRVFNKSERDFKEWTK